MFETSQCSHAHRTRLRLTPTDFIDVENWWDALGSLANRSRRSSCLLVIQKPRTSAHHNAPHSCYPDPEPTPQQLIGGIMAQNNIWPRHRQTRRPSTLNPNVAKAFALGTDAITDGRERANRPKNFPRLYPAITSLSHPSPMHWGGTLSTRNGTGLAFVTAEPYIF